MNNPENCTVCGSPFASCDCFRAGYLAAMSLETPGPVTVSTALVLATRIISYLNAAGFVVTKTTRKEHTVELTVVDARVQTP